MSISIDRILDSLSEEERIFAEANADVLDLSVGEFVCLLIREQLTHEFDDGETMPLVH